MASEGKLLFDLNELPTEDDDGNDYVNCNQPQEAIPSANSNTTSALLATPSCSQDNVNNRVFSHASTVSGFQPFVRPLAAQSTDVAVGQKMDEDSHKESLSSSRSDTFVEAKVASSVVPNDAGVPEREEGEWTESEGPANESVHSSSDYSKVTEKDNGTIGLDINSNSGLQKRSVNHISEGSGKDSASIDNPQEQGLTVRQRETRGVEASHAIKCANTTVKRKMDHQKETMLGKKRNRQTMFLNLEDVKQAGPIKTTTPRRQNFPQPVVTRTVRESRAGPPPAEQGGGIPAHVVYRDQKPIDIPNGGIHPETSEHKLESNGESQAGSVGKTRRVNGEAGPSAEGTSTSVSRQGSWKQPINSRQSKIGHLSNRQASLGSQSSTDSKFGNKKFTSFKKQVTNSNQYQDTSVERLIREVTSEKFWHHPGNFMPIKIYCSGASSLCPESWLSENRNGHRIWKDTELQSVPERFESMDEYVRVFEPLLFEECRAQLYSTWEELAEANSYMKVRIKFIERRERGWYDVILLSVNDCKWAFKEGDVAVLSNPVPESEGEHEDAGRVAGTVRRYIPVGSAIPNDWFFSIAVSLLPLRTVRTANKRCNFVVTF